MKRLVCLLLCLCPLLCSCSYSYLERQAFPICMSIDLDEKGRYRVGVQAPQSTSEDQPTYDIMSATGDTLNDALRVLAASTPYPLNFCQLRLCLIGYELAATTQLRTLTRELFELPTMRPNAYVMVALGSAMDVMEKQKPDLGMRMSTQLGLLFERLRQENMLPDSTLSACVRELGDMRRDPLLCICAVNSTLTQKQGEPLEGGQGGASGGGQSSGGGGSDESQSAFAVGEPWSDKLLPQDIAAGMLPRTGSNPVEYLGSAAVSDGRVSGMLTARETQVILRAMREAERRMAYAGDRLQLQVLVKSGTELARERETLEQALYKLQLLDSDALGFGEISATAFLTDAEWEGFRFKERYKQADILLGEN